MELKIFKIDGSETGETVQLPSDIFEIEPNMHLIYQAVRSYRAAQRQGTHKTKTRREVSGGGKKPFKQKGTGNARQGTSRSPIMVGGGNIHGPQPHKYNVSLPKKAAKLARKSALSIKAKENEIMVIEDFSFDAPKTQDIANILKSLKLNDKKTLLLLGDKNDNVYKSGRNIAKLSVQISGLASTYDLVNNKMILLQRSAVDSLTKSFNS
jgi:large subunit ribosomal protein L4